MPDGHSQIERLLVVGRVAVLQTEPQRKDGPRFPTAFIGWRRERSIFIEHPRTPDGREVAFRDGHPCVLRFVHEGQACAFATDIIEWGGSRHESQVRLRWPAQVDTLTLRRFDRIPFQAPCRVTLPDGQVAHSHLNDLSTGGCSLTGLEMLKKDDTIALSFGLPDGAMINTLRAVVRASRAGPLGNVVGCEFEAGQDIAHNDISLYVTAQLARGRAGDAGAAASKVLIVDANTDQVEKLRRLLARQGLEAVAVGNVVDACHMVRVMPLRAIAVSQAMRELPGLDICRIVRAARGTDKLRLFLYGGGPELDAQAAAAGLEKWLPDSPSLTPDLVLELKKAMADNMPC